MTLAREIETNRANWESGTPGVGRLAQGNTGGSAPTQLAVDDPSGSRT
jgi:hypothetical protein